MNAYDKIRYALIEAKGWLLECLNEDNPPTKDGLNEAIDRIDAALSIPRRNCDVGTEEEQGTRCLAQIRAWRFGGPRLIDSIMKWTQMPYEESNGVNK